MMTNNPAKIGTLALEAMLVEVSVTPKPGLVDRNNSGAHKDMNFFTFLRSAASLRSSFEEFAEAGYVGGEKGFLPSQVFPLIRKIGIEAEKRMFHATNGINTHKGEIFSLGLLSACVGYLAGAGETLNTEKIMQLSSEMCSGICERDFADVQTKKFLTKGERVYLEHGEAVAGSCTCENPKAEEIMRLAAEMCAGICERDFADVHTKKILTKGERVYLEHGITGIRGEAEAGYPVVRDVGLPALRKYLAEGLSLNDALAFTLINIMANAQDTNIISRHDLQTAQEVMRRAKRILAEGSGVEGIVELDREFIDEWISPGGSGDLLAVTYFLHKA